MTLTLQNVPETSIFLDSLKNFLSQWQGIQIETKKTQDTEEFDHYISDEEILSDPETLEAMKECEYILTHPEEYKAYHDVDEMFKDLLAND